MFLYTDGSNTRDRDRQFFTLAKSPRRKERKKKRSLSIGAPAKHGPKADTRWRAVLFIVASGAPRKARGTRLVLRATRITGRPTMKDGVLALRLLLVSHERMDRVQHFPGSIDKQGGNGFKCEELCRINTRASTTPQSRLSIFEWKCNASKCFTHRIYVLKLQKIYVV